MFRPAPWGMPVRGTQGVLMEEESVAAERIHLWDRDTLEEEAWLIHLPSSRHASDVTVTELTDTAGRAPGNAKSALRPHPFEDLACRLLSALCDGPGLVVLRGLPLDELSDQACAELCRSAISLAGTPRPPESAAPMDHLLTTVPTSRVSAPADPDDILRGPAEEAALAPHTDRAGPSGPPRLLALLCVRPALKGGESLLVSGHSVHDRLSADRPAVLSTLYRDFYFGAERNLARSGPVFTRSDGRLQVRYNRYQIERGHHAAGEPLTAAQVEALDAFDEVLGDESLFLRLPLRRGDLLMLNNNTVLHGRTSFTDHPDPLQHRCLARAWAD
ncbi:TauD/TfdA family dioxygenase [Streptomyces sp. NBC_01433]|uniref:TauD/TfdA family dioxygenase n=1 Tax=Streptomyces sp. NBC_01433 TaxID=2903864 RepID=UPI00224F2CB6|nr:TauD/TfdA family dioxygenase [Streptomyces sp. NBC_01433]MCX4679246.1 TauD/TfdA family dioxygenase [Streptomyces sp. NBC_01433]